MGRNVFTANPDPYLWLIEVTSPDDGPLVDPAGGLVVPRLTPNRTPITWGQDAQGQPKTFDPYPILFGDLAIDGEGSTFDLALSLSNAGARLMPMLEANEFLHGHRVQLILVHSSSLNNPADAAVIPLRVADMSADWDNATFSLSSFDESSFEIPQTILTRNSCRWRYRGPGCDFVGDPDNTLGNCARTFSACEARGAYEEANGLAKRHPLRFGAFRGLLRGPITVTSA